MRAYVRLFHRFLGLLFGLIFMAVCLSGSILVFEDELIDWLDRDLRVEAPAQIDADQLNQAIEAQLGEGEVVKRIYLPPGRVRLKGPDQQRVLYFDPRDGRYLGEGTQLLSLVLNFHRRLLLSDFGRWLTLLSALAASTLVISGLQLWWPRQKSKWKSYFRVKSDGSRRRFLFDLHRVGGVFSSGIILILVLTGLNYSLVSDSYRALVGALGGGKASLPGAPRVESQEGPRVSLEQALRVAQDQFPGLPVTSIDPPQDLDRALTIRFRGEGQPGEFGRTAVYLDPWTGEVLGRLDASQLNPAQKWVNVWALPLHRGRAFGYLHQLLWLLGSLLGAMLPATGIWLWWNRRKTAASRASRPEESPPSKEPA